MARTEFGVAVASILIVAGVLAVPLVAPAQTAATTPLAHPIIKSTPNASDLVGAGCDSYTKLVPTGSGSIVGMSADPVAVAASNNPDLTKLTAAVSGKLNSGVNLVSTLDSGQYTVFAPVDSAFAKLPAATLAALEKPANAAELTSILTFHVVKGQLNPANLDGTLKTLEGASLTVTGSGDDIKVNGASVICGGIHTSNATVYLIDTVLTPPKS